MPITPSFHLICFHLRLPRGQPDAALVGPVSFHTGANAVFPLGLPGGENQTNQKVPFYFPSVFGHPLC